MWLITRVRRAASDLLAWPVAAKAMLVVELVVAATFSALAGGAEAIIAMLVSVAILLALAALVSEHADLRFLLVTVAGVVLVREIVAMALDLRIAATSAGHVFAPDEGLYLRVASNVAANWRDPAVFVDPNDGNVQSQFVRSVAAIFFLIGPNIAVVKIMNTMLAVAMPLLVYRTMVNLELRGRRLAVLVLLLFPSLALWSTLVLKDAYVWFFIVAVVWSSSEYIRSRNPWWHLVTVAALLPIDSVRRYIFVTMAVAWLFVILAVHGRERIRAAAVIVPAVLAMFAIMQPLRDLGINPLYVPIFIREASAVGARTSFVEPLPAIRGEPGQRFVVSAPNDTPPPGSTPREVLVQPGQQVVFEGAPTPTASSFAVVRPGDVIVIATPGAVAGTRTASPAPTAGGSPTPTPEPTPTPKPIPVQLVPSAKNSVALTTQVDSDATSLEGSAATNLRHLPIGLLFVLAAPFPWTARTPSELLTIPEMIIWYVCVLLAFLGVTQLLTRRDLRYAHGAAALAGITIIFALIQGSVGTLVRSRDMMVPFTIVLTGVGFDYLIRTRRRLFPAWLVRLLSDRA